MSKTGNITATNDYPAITAAIAYLSETSADRIDLKAFARALGLTRRQLDELFLRWCGLSPKSFAQAVALDHARKLLRQQASVLETANEIGLSSTSRLYDLFVSHFAMPPGVWAKSGEGLDMVWGIAPSPFGRTVLFTSDYGIAGIGFVDETKTERAAFADLASRWPGACFKRNDQLVAPIAAQIFNPTLWDQQKKVRIVMIGTDFEVTVWQALLKIPMGEVTTYGRIAGMISKPSAARAVGAAIGRNPISFVVPCHRVVGASGKLTGYHWGVTRKRAILGWETGQASKP